MNWLGQMILIGMICWLFNGCNGDSRVEPDRNSAPIGVKRVDLQRRIPVEQIQRTPPRETFRVAVAAMLSAQRTFESYQVLLDYLGEYLQMPIAFKQRQTYEEINVLLERGQLDLAFICTGAYIPLRERIPVEIVGVPVVEGKTTYQSYIIVFTNSPIQEIADLRGKHFAFTDPLSNTGKLYPTYLLAEIGTTPGAFFASFIYTNSHDNSIQAVAQGNVDGAAVDSLIYDQLAQDTPDLIGQVRIIHKSFPMAMPPVVLSPTVSESLKTKIRAFFFHLHENTRGRHVLGRLQIERFVAAHDSDYDKIRQMRLLVGEEGARRPGNKGTGW
jgi:phosphonate transport system substrate-binding protein